MTVFVAALDPELLIQRGGLLLLAAIVFAESGLLFGFFLPGDSLLFAAGAATAVESGGLPTVWVVIAVVIAAAIAGDQVGYRFGRQVGTALDRRPPSRFFRPEHLRRSELFVERHGPRAIVLARFVPIVRTFAPIVAGVGTMRYRAFVTSNIVGGILWGGGVTLLGHLVGGVGVVRDHFELAIVIVIGVSLVPVALEARRHRAGPDSPVGSSGRSVDTAPSLLVADDGRGDRDL